MKQQPQQRQEPPPSPSPAFAAGGSTDDLRLRIRSDAVFFDELIKLIPGKFYLPTPDDDSKPWFQGLSKAARASAKQQTRENIKKSRRDRHDPEKSRTTTLDLLERSMRQESDSIVDNEGEEGERIEMDNVKDFDVDKQSVTYEELQHRLHCKLEALRANRGQGKRSSDDGKDLVQKKRKRSDEFGNYSGAGIKSKNLEKLDTEEDVVEATKGIEFGKVKLGSDDSSGGKKMKKKKQTKAKELEAAKKLQETKKDPEKGEMMAKKHSWKAAASRAMGIKVHDNPKLLKQSIQKEKKRHQKNAEKWKERVETREKFKEEKQQKRAGNIAERIHQKKMRKIEKREKKLMRPGFEGRKEGYIGDS